jgi:hypothetical protein
MKKLTNRLAALLVAAMAAGGSYAVGDDFKYALINNPAYPTTDLGVASINGVDEGLDNTGATDCTAKIQELLDKLANVTNPDKNSDQGLGNRGAAENQTGGVLYLPEGQYRVEGQIMIPRGVTLRGDWKKPENGQPVSGTVILAYGEKGTDDELKALFTMQPSTQICNLSIFYPEQDPNNVSKYPPAIVYGQHGYFGNDYCNVRNVTFVNPYTAILFSSYNGGGCPNIFGIYGTPLYQGVVMDRIADVGRFDHIYFSPSYWANSGLGTEYSESAIKNYTYNNSTGIVMRRNDWSYTCNYDCEGYHTAFRTEWTPATRPDGGAIDDASRGRPNGHNYGFNVSGCQYAIDLTASSGSGIMFTRINVDDCTEAVRLGNGAEGPIQFYGCDFASTGTTVDMVENASVPLMFKDCNIDGNVNALGGQLMADGTTFCGDVYVAPAARAILTGNTFNGELNNSSLYECVVSDQVAYSQPLPEFKQEWMEVPVTKPAKEALFVVTDAAYGAEPINTNTKVNPDGLSSAKDNTAAIQNALNAAKANGGGIVYLPSGHYRMNGNITIPEGVELKGSSDIASVPRGNGAILEVFAGKGNENAEPFITMEPNSGLRGITINYPEQTDPANVQKYPYAVRGNAGVYIVNLALRATYHGVDLFTNKCDNHYVDYISGHSFGNVIRVGGGSEGGLISNIQCNTIAYSNGYESKYGFWANSPEDHEDIRRPYAYGQNKESLEFLIVGDCKDQVLYNNFLFGCNKGIVFQNDGNGGATGIGLGNAVDGAVNTVVFNGLNGSFPLINSQIVALNHTDGDDSKITPGHEALSAHFITTGPDFKGTADILSSNNWGGGDHFAEINGGTVNLILTNMAAAGSVYTANVAEGAKLNIADAFFKSVTSMVETPEDDEARISVAASVLDVTGSSSLDFASYEDNLSIQWKIGNKDVFSNFSGWTASASDNGANANRAIDSNGTTRWDTGTAQTAGQWFDLLNEGGETVTMGGLLLDASASPNDGPDGYRVEVHTRATDEWKTVAEGENGGGMLLIMFNEEVKRVDEVKITQTATKSSGYWSIHEIYFTNGYKISSDIDDVASGEGDGISITDGVLYAGENDGVAVFALDGTKKFEVSGKETVQLGGLEGGVYIVAVKKPEGMVVRKISLSK